MKKQVVIIHGGDTFDAYEEYIASTKPEKATGRKGSRKNWGQILK